MATKVGSSTHSAGGTRAAECQREGQTCRVVRACAVTAELCTSLTGKVRLSSRETRPPGEDPALTLAGWGGALGSHKIKVRGVSCRALAIHPAFTPHTHTRNPDPMAALRPASRVWSQRVTKITERERREPGLGVGRAEGLREAWKCQRQGGGVPLAARCQGRPDALEGTEGQGAPASGHSAPYSRMRASCPAWPRRRAKAPHPERPGSARGGVREKGARAVAGAGRHAPPVGGCPAAWAQLRPPGPAARSWERLLCPARPRLSGQTLLTLPLVPHASHTQTCRWCSKNTSLQIRHSLCLAHDSRLSPACCLRHRGPASPRNAPLPRRPCAWTCLSVNSVTLRAPACPAGDPWAFSLYVPTPYTQEQIDA